LDSDYTLLGEVANEFDLLFGERAYLASRQAERADAFLVPEHRHRNNGADASVHGRDRQSIAAAVGRTLSKILDLNRFPCKGRAHDWSIVNRPNRCAASPLRGKGFRPCAMQDGAAEPFTLAQPDGSVTGLTEPHSVHYHGVEDRAQFTG